MARSNLGAALSRAGPIRRGHRRVPRGAGSWTRAICRCGVNLALAYYKTAQISEAAEELTAVVQQQPANRQAVFLLADCDLRLGENKKVIELLSPLEKAVARTTRR